MANEPVPSMNVCSTGSIRLDESFAGKLSIGCAGVGERRNQQEQEGVCQGRTILGGFDLGVYNTPNSLEVKCTYLLPGQVF